MAGFILQFEALFLLNIFKVNHFFLATLAFILIYFFVLRKAPKSLKGLDIYKVYFPAGKSSGNSNASILHLPFSVSTFKSFSLELGFSLKRFTFNYGSPLLSFFPPFLFPSSSAFFKA